MDDKACQNCGAPLVVRSSQIVQLPGDAPKCYVDYDCPSGGCKGSIRVMTTPTRSETASPGRVATELPRPRRVPDDEQPARLPERSAGRDGGTALPHR
jgi:hypothetical protein